MATFLGIAAATWGVVMAIAPILQIRLMIIRRSSGDLSLGYFGVLLPGFALWIGYGWTRGDWALVVPNTFALTVGVITVAVALLLRRRTTNGGRLTTNSCPAAGRGFPARRSRQR
jgi:MtN3 and saliva related transmembrane protein